VSPSGPLLISGTNTQLLKEGLVKLKLISVPLEALGLSLNKVVIPVLFCPTLP
jgi:hypothetical protein